MRNPSRWIPALLLPVLICASQARALDRSAYDELVRIMERARLAETDVFAPATWTKVLESFEKAEKALAGEKKQKTLDKYVDRASEYAQNAIKASEVAKLSLKEYLPPRDRALAAKAPTLAPELFVKAEARLMKATGKVESGNVKGALEEAEKAIPLYDEAELEAVRVEILGTADRLIEKALVDDAGKYAPSTLDKARSARERADAILTADRYERGESLAQAARAEYEARHASNIGLSVRSLKRNDQAWEKLMLVYEIQMNRVGEVFELEHLPFQDGPAAAADTLIGRVAALRSEHDRLDEKLASISSQLGQALGGSGQSPTGSDPLQMAEAATRRLNALMTEKDDLATRIDSDQAKLAELTAEHEEMSGELSLRLEREERFKRAKSMLTPADGDVLFNAANDIVLRLSGLSFAVGKSDITDEQMPLLEKTKAIIQMFPEAKVAVEGHTDTSGDATTNQQLSEKRAYAVMQYLRQSLLISADRIQSIGYGADRPVASNQTADGRAKNRRIDIVIMQ